MNAEESRPSWWRRLKGWQQLVVTLVSAVLALALVGFVLAQLGSEPVDSPATRPAPAQREVTYEVEGTIQVVDITVETPTGSSQQSDLAVPLTNNEGEVGLTMMFEAGDFVYISAQNPLDSGDVTCRITVDGEVISENTATGGYSIATCKGSA